MWWYWDKKTDLVTGPMPIEEWHTLNKDKTFQRTSRVALTVVKQLRISTVFLGIPHTYDETPGLFFETMVFDDGKDRDDVFCHRYDTPKQARQGHKALVKWLRENKEIGDYEPK